MKFGKWKERTSFSGTTCHRSIKTDSYEAHGEEKMETESM